MKRVKLTKPCYKCGGSHYMKAGGDFKPHIMVNPQTGQTAQAQTYEDHLALGDQGYVHADEMRKALRPRKKMGGANGIAEQNQSIDSVTADRKGAMLDHLAGNAQEIMYDQAIQEASQQPPMMPPMNFGGNWLPKANFGFEFKPGAAQNINMYEDAARNANKGFGVGNAFQDGAKSDMWSNLKGINFNRQKNFYVDPITQEGKDWMKDYEKSYKKNIRAMKKDVRQWGPMSQWAAKYGGSYYNHGGPHAPGDGGAYVGTISHYDPTLDQYIEIPMPRKEWDEYMAEDSPYGDTRIIDEATGQPMYKEHPYFANMSPEQRAYYAQHFGSEDIEGMDGAQWQMNMDTGEWEARDADGNLIDPSTGNVVSTDQQVSDALDNIGGGDGVGNTGTTQEGNVSVADYTGNTAGTDGQGTQGQGQGQGGQDWASAYGINPQWLGRSKGFGRTGAPMFMATPGSQFMPGWDYSRKRKGPLGIFGKEETWHWNPPTGGGPGTFSPDQTSITQPTDPDAPVTNDPTKTQGPTVDYDGDGIPDEYPKAPGTGTGPANNPGVTGGCFGGNCPKPSGGYDYDGDGVPDEGPVAPAGEQPAAPQEEAAPSTETTEGDVISPEGDPYEYKKVGNKYLTKKKGSDKWIEASGNAENAIKNKIYGEDASYTPASADNTTGDLADQVAAAEAEQMKILQQQEQDAEMGLPNLHTNPETGEYDANKDLSGMTNAGMNAWGYTPDMMEYVNQQKAAFAPPVSTGVEIPGDPANLPVSQERYGGVPKYIIGGILGGAAGLAGGALAGGAGLAAGIAAPIVAPVVGGIAANRFMKGKGKIGQMNPMAGNSPMGGGMFGKRFGGPSQYAAGGVPVASWISMGHEAGTGIEEAGKGTPFENITKNATNPSGHLMEMAWGPEGRESNRKIRETVASTADSMGGNPTEAMGSIPGMSRYGGVPQMFMGGMPQTPGMGMLKKFDPGIMDAVGGIHQGATNIMKPEMQRGGGFPSFANFQGNPGEMYQAVTDFMKTYGLIHKANGNWRGPQKPPMMSRPGQFRNVFGSGPQAPNRQMMMSQYGGESSLGGVVEMSNDEIRQFLADGGTIEYVD